MIPPFDPVTGALPLGRFPATLTEVAQVLVTDIGTERRSELWGELRDVTTILASHVAVASAWLSGSFVTTKPDPQDIDVVYWVENVELERARGIPASASVLQEVTTPGRLHELGLRVDAYVIPWVSNETAAARGPQDLAYHQARGYWDDLWLRLRSGPKGATPTRLDSIPRRGYLEVSLGGLE